MACAVDQLLCKYALAHVYLALGNHMAELLRKWTSHGHLGRAKALASERLSANAGVKGLQLTTLELAAVYSKLTDGSISKDTAKESVFSLCGATVKESTLSKESILVSCAAAAKDTPGLYSHALIIIQRTCPILGEKTAQLLSAFEAYSTQGALDSIRDLISDLMLSERDLRDNLQAMQSFDYERLWVVPGPLQEPDRNYFQDLVLDAVQHEFRRRSHLEQAALLADIARTHEHIQGPSLEIVAHNIRARISSCWARVQKDHGPSLEEARRLLTDSFPRDRDALLECIEDRRKFLSQAFYNKLLAEKLV